MLILCNSFFWALHFPPLIFSFFQSKLELWQISTLSMWHVVSPIVWPSVTRASCFPGVQVVMGSWDSWLLRILWQYPGKNVSYCKGYFLLVSLLDSLVWILVSSFINNCCFLWVTVMPYTVITLVPRIVIVEVFESCLAVSDPASPWTTQSMKFLRPEYWPFPSPGDLPNPGIEPRSPELQADSLPAEPQGKPDRSVYLQLKNMSCLGTILHLSQ